MLYYIKKYPFSVAIIIIIIYLSFFKPPSIDGPRIPYFDKIAHVCMYAGLSGMLWLEFLRNHRYKPLPMLHVWIGAIICPIVFSGLIEIMQEYCTSYRGGDWLDFAANTTGVILASLIGFYVIRPWMNRK